MEGYQQGSGTEREEGKVQRINSINGRWKIDRGCKNSIRNVEAKELTCMTHGHELSREGMWEGGCLLYTSDAADELMRV